MGKSFLKCISLFFLLNLLGAYTFVQAQGNDFSEPGSFNQEGYLGYTMYQPNLKMKGFEISNPWEGFEFKSGIFHASFTNGDFRKIDADSSINRIKGHAIRFGAHLGKSFRAGVGELGSVAVNPYIRIGTSYLSVPNIDMGGSYAFSLEFNPGVEFKISHFYLSANYQLGLGMPLDFWNQNKKYNIYKKTGLMHGLQLTVGVHNAFDLLIPKVYTFSGRRYKDKTTTSYGYLDLYDSRGVYRGTYGATFRKTYRTYKASEDKAFSLISPFFGIGPYYSFHSQRERQAASSMYGLNAGFRVGYFMIDAFMGKGTLGLKDVYTKQDLMIAFPKLQNYNFSSQIEVEEYGAKIGLNLTRLLSEVGFEYDDDSYTSSMSVPFIRLHGILTLGYTEFVGKPKYIYEGAGKRLEDYHAIHNIESTIKNNATFLEGEKQFYTGMGVNLEYGQVFAEVSWFKYKNAKVADHMQYKVGFNYPIVKMIMALSGNKKVKD